MYQQFPTKTTSPHRSTISHDLHSQAHLDPQATEHNQLYAIKQSQTSTLTHKIISSAGLSSVRCSDEVSDEIVHFDALRSVSRSQDMTSNLPQPSAFVSEPLSQEIPDGGLTIDALLPETESDTLQMPMSLQVPLVMNLDGSRREAVRSLIDTSAEGDTAVRGTNIQASVGEHVHTSEGAVGSNTHMSLPLHASQHIGFGYHTNNGGDSPMLQRGSSAAFTIPDLKDNGFDEAAVDPEAVEPMLLLGRSFQREIMDSTRDTGIRREANNCVNTENVLEVPNGFLQVKGEKRLETAAVSREIGDARGETPTEIGSTQRSIRGLMKPKTNVVNVSTQNPQLSPSSPAYSAVTTSPSAMIQTSQSLAVVEVRNRPTKASLFTNMTAEANGVGVSVNVVGGETNASGTVTQSNIGGNNKTQFPKPTTVSQGLVCPICKTQFTRRYNLKVHMSSKHSARRDYHCKQCPNAFNRGDSLKRHIATTHRGEKKWRCSYCQRDFGQRPHMKMHIDTVHLKKRDHKCHCGKAFGTRYNLTAHQRTHQQIPKKHLCGVCNKSFALKSSLARHQRNSGHEQPHNESDDK